MKHKKYPTIAPQLAEQLWHPVVKNDRTVKSKNNGNFSGDLNQAGYISDDTILTLAGLQSLINTSKLDLIDLFQEHSNFIKQYGTMGFGKGTLASIRQMESGYAPLEAGQLSRGNGVLMKQFPYALALHLQGTAPEVADKTIAQIAQCTHTTPIAQLTAILHNRMLQYLLTLPSDARIDREKILPHLYVLAQTYEKNQLYTEGLRDADSACPASTIIRKLHDQRLALQANRPYTLEHILDTYTVTGSNPHAKYSFHVASTFGYVYSILMQQPNRSGLLATIRIGEDTDSQAAIIGTMIGAHQGPFYPADLIDQLQAKDHIARVLQAVQEKV